MLDDAVAERRLRFAHGTAILSPSLHDVYDANFLRAERDRIKAFNVTARKGRPDESLLNDQERASLDSERRFSGAYMERRKGQFPAYHLANLNGNIARQRARLEGLKGRASIPEPPRELVTHGVGEGLRGYITKVAVVRGGDAPIGEPGPLYLNCPCGAKPTTRLDLNAPDVTCACGVTYSSSGWKR